MGELLFRIAALSVLFWLLIGVYRRARRDYFAAKALAALIGHPNKEGINCGKSAVPRLAAFAYEYADAMIAARTQPAPAGDQQAKE